MKGRPLERGASLQLSAASEVVGHATHRLYQQQSALASTGKYNHRRHLFLKTEDKKPQKQHQHMVPPVAGCEPRPQRWTSGAGATLTEPDRLSRKLLEISQRFSCSCSHKEADSYPAAGLLYSYTPISPPISAGALACLLVSTLHS